MSQGVGVACPTVPSLMLALHPPVLLHCLQLCGHLKVGQMLAVELLMTPDSPTDFLSEAQLMSDYSFLTDLSSGLRIDHPDWSLAPSPFASTDDYGRNQYVADTAAAAMAAMAAEGAGAQGEASAAAAAAAAAMADEQRA